MRAVIGNLSDDVICHILSFLPTKYACRTCLLSRRWKSLWTMVPDLDFHLPSRSSHDKRECFAHFVNAVLHQRTAKEIRKFRLSCELCSVPNHVITWVWTVIRCKVQELDLDVCLDKITRWPHDLFTCKSLVVLKLRSNIQPQFPSYVSLPSLKTLHLHLTDLQINGDFFSTFLSGCPLLEELQLTGKLRFSIHISVPTLKKLKLHFMGHFHTYKLEINTPSLEVLDLTDGFLQNYEIVNMHNVARVTLSIYKDHYTNSLFKLFDGLSNVKSLSLTSDTIKYLCGGDLGILHLPEFHSLAYLWVELSKNCSWDILVRFLQNAQKLKVLVIKKNFKRNPNRGELAQRWTGPISIPVSLSTSLKVFEFRGIQNIRAELDFVQYIIENTSELKKVKIIRAKLKAKPTSKSLIDRKLSEMQKVSSVSIWDIQFVDNVPEVNLEG